MDLDFDPKPPAISGYNIARSGLLLIASLALSNCGLVQRSEAEHKAMMVDYIIGSPERAEFDNIRMKVPGSYIEPKMVQDFPSGSYVSAVPFTAAIDTFDGAALDWREKHTISGQMSPQSNGYLSRTVDGSWLNYYSAYKVPMGEKFGLEVRMTEAAEFDPRTLYVSLTPDEETTIECIDYPSPDRPQSCGMRTQERGAPYITIGMLQSDLPRWKYIRAGANKLAEEWIKAAEAGRQK